MYLSQLKISLLGPLKKRQVIHSFCWKRLGFSYWLWKQSSHILTMNAFWFDHEFLIIFEAFNHWPPIWKRKIESKSMSLGLYSNQVEYERLIDHLSIKFTIVHSLSYVKFVVCMLHVYLQKNIVLIFWLIWFEY